MNLDLSLIGYIKSNPKWNTDLNVSHIIYKTSRKKHRIESLGFWAM